MTIQETFIRADEELTRVINQVGDDQWDMRMPEDFPSGDPSRTYTMREVIDYHAYDEAWIPDMLAGRTMEEVGKDAFGEPFGGKLLGDTPKEKYAELSAKAVAAARELPDDALDSRAVHYSYGDFPAREALWHAISFRGLRVHDLAKVIGVNSDIPEDLLRGLWDIIEPRAEEWRQMGVFGPKVDVPEDAPLQDRLLGLTGRKP